MDTICEIIVTPIIPYVGAQPNIFSCFRSEITEAFVEMASRMTQDIIRHARLLQQRKNEACCSVDGHVNKPRESHDSHMNVFDVHVGDTRSDAGFQEVEVSVRKSEGASLEDCLKQLDELDLNALQAESE
jgi:hypothetical protein